MTSRINKLERKRKTPKNPARKLAILKAAESVFAEKGFTETTISEISKKAKTSEATLYDYFSSKEDLLFSIPAETTGRNLKENKKILEHVRGAANKLRVLICRHLTLYDENPDYARIVTLILKANRNFIGTRPYKTVQEAAKLFVEVLEEGKKSGEFRPELNPYLVRAMVWGTIEHLCTRMSLLGKPEKLLPYADPLFEYVLRGIEIPKEDRTIKLHITLGHKDGEEATF